MGMKFTLAVNMERLYRDVSFQEVQKSVLDLVKMADQSDMEIVWAAEHHTIETIIAPNPFTIMTHWAAHTKRIRIGAACAIAPYWHPIRLAGEAALFDHFSDGRLEFGIARGAFQYEFDRMIGIPQWQGGEYMFEMLPLIKQLWTGDVAHEGKRFKFPTATATPKPLQQPFPPIWTAARSPETFAWAIDNELDIMSTALHKPFAEVKVLAEKLKVAIAERPGKRKPRWLVLRRGFVYDTPNGWKPAIQSTVDYARAFEGLFHNTGGAKDGFPDPVDFEQISNKQDFTPEALRENLLIGTPDEVVEKLKGYEELGVDYIAFNPCAGVEANLQRRSLELLIEKVMPHFKDESPRAAAE